MDFLNLVEDLKEKIPVPNDISQDFFMKLVWLSGRNEGIDVIRTHVRHKIKDPVPYLQEPPERIIENYGESVSRVWEKGYNTALMYVENEIRNGLSSCNSI